jgi:lysophospholipid acyltransferase (LPLAT)-like uncharacterized protein
MSGSTDAGRAVLAHSSMNAPVPFAWLARLCGLLLLGYVRLIVLTCRIRGAATRDQVVLTFWHEFNLAALVVALKCRRDLRHASFSTRGFRGLVITTMLERSRAQVQVLPLPPERDRGAARDFALRLAGLAATGLAPVVTPDGPFGPYQIAKPGTLIIARESGLAIQPWAMAVRPALRLSGRWDRQVLPLPFCSLRVVEGRRLQIGEGERLSPRLAELQSELMRTTAASS